MHFIRAFERINPPKKAFTVPKAHLTVPHFLLGRPSHLDDSGSRMVKFDGLEPISSLVWLTSGDRGQLSDFLAWFEVTVGLRPVRVQRHHLKGGEGNAVVTLVPWDGVADRPDVVYRPSGFAIMRTREEAAVVMARYRAMKPLLYQGRPFSLADMDLAASEPPLIVRHVRPGVQEYVGWWGEDRWMVLLEGERREGCAVAETVKTKEDFCKAYGYGQRGSAPDPGGPR
jgi:hypothetical protein